MSTVDYIVERLTQAAPDADLPPAVWRFDFGDDGTVTVNSRVEPTRVSRDDAGVEPDCTLTMAADHLALVLRGQVTVGAAYLKFVRASTGDLELTVRMQRLLRAAVAQNAFAG